jgi:excinuclease ABC subunit C
MQGKEATGSMVTFIEGKPDKKFYRKFKIKIAGKPNDTAMLKEILERRLKHKEWIFPDLILIDGGKPQLSAGASVKYPKSIKFAALAKRKNELFIKGKKNPILLKTLPREIFNLILRLRDEAHRFAISYHKKLRKDNTFT